MIINIRVSVTDLAQFVCRQGDLASGGVIGPSARQGQKAHQRWQAKRNDATEISVKAKLIRKNITVQLGGRIDAFDKEKQHITEIKSTMVPVEQISEAQKDLHRSQVKLYAYCLINTEFKQATDLMWTLDVLYINLRNEEPTIDRETTSVAELVAFGNSVLDQYVDWIVKVEACRENTRKTAKALQFPFESFRDGQYRLASVVYRGARDGFSSLIEAPTGIGKTISTLFPAMKAVGEGEVNQVVYLTAKTSGVNAVFDAVQKMDAQGLSLNSVVLRSKQLTCFCSNGRCERDETGRCPMTLGFFERLPEARDALLSKGVITPDELDEIALQYELCPFELALQMLPWVSLVVCDYNYVFDPLVRLTWFSEPHKRSLVLIDEAHNLPDRSRSMYSAKLDRFIGQEVLPSLLPGQQALVEHVSSVDRALLKHARSLDTKASANQEHISRDSPDGLRKPISAAIEQLMEIMGTGPALSFEAVEWFKALCRYAVIDELFNESHRTITQIDKYRGKKTVRVNLVCLDASKELHKQYKHYKSVSFFSATLRPISFYHSTLGSPDSSKYLQLPSPFDPNNCNYILVPSIGTRYREREGSLPNLVQLIHDVSVARTGSYLVFFPSFAYLNKVAEAFSQKFPEQVIWKQSQGQTREERQQQLDKLTSAGPHLGFVIMGGVFGEGVDYVGEKLIGAVVVGVGLPGVSAEQDLMAEHFNGLGYDGYDYANRIPGLIRVLQTAGRVIRSESDKGVVVFVDDRFQSSFYQSNLPNHIKPVVCFDRDSWRRELVWSHDRRDDRTGG